MAITNYKKVVEKLNEIDEKDVVSYMIMVETNKTSDDNKTSDGVNAAEGEGHRLMNLISNIDKTLIMSWLAVKVLED